MKYPLIHLRLLLLTIFLIPMVTNAQTPPSSKPDLPEAVRKDPAAQEFLLEQETFWEAKDYTGYVEVYAKLARLYERSGTNEIRQKCIDLGLKDGKALLEENAPTLGTLHLVNGEFLIGQGKMDEGQTELFEALRILKESDRSEDLTWGYLDMSMLHYLEMDLDSADYFLDQGRQVCQQYLPRSHDATYTIPDLAGVYANRSGHYRKALAAAEESMSLQQEFFEGGRGDSVSLGNTFNTVAAIYFQLGDLKSAISYYFKALSMYNDHPDTKAEIGRTLNNLGIAYEHKGNIEKALQLLLQAKPFHEEPKNIIAAKDALINLNNLVSLHLQIGQPEVADRFMADLLALTEAWNYSKELPLFYQGRIATFKGDYDSALHYYNSSLDVLLRLDKERTIGTGKKHLEIGRIYSQRDQLDSALFHFQKAVSDYAYDFNSDDPAENPAADGYFPEWRILEALVEKGKCLMMLADRNPVHKERLIIQAESSFLAGVSIFQGFRNRHANEQTRLRLSQVGHPLFSGAIRSTLDHYDYAPHDSLLRQAFGLAEQARAQTLLESHWHSQSLQNSSIPDYLQEQGKRIENDLAFYQGKILKEEAKEEKSDSIRLNSWRNILFDLEREEEEWERMVRSVSPGFFRYRGKSSSPTPEQVMDSLLAKNEALIEYFWGEVEVDAFVISESGLHVYRSPITPSLEQELASFRRSISDYVFVHDSVVENYQLFCHTASQLYNQFLATPLINLPEVKNLLILPDGLLQQIPFEALLNKPPSNEGLDFLSLPYLIRNYRIHYGYSTELSLEGKRSSKPSSMEGCLALAPSSPSDQALQTRGSMGALRSRGSNETVLEGALLEVSSIADCGLKGKYLFGPYAREDQFKLLSPEYRILHLAMHGYADIADPGLSKLLFTESPDSCEDGVLYAHELQVLNLNADLVVLSACESGFGQILQGEGVLSLGRAFMEAGAESVVMTLWKVEDKASRSLMTRFYENLSEGNSSANALHDSKLEFLKRADSRLAHPFYWAGYVASGDVAPLEESGGEGIKWSLFLLVLLAMVFNFWWRLRDK